MFLEKRIQIQVSWDGDRQLEAKGQDGDNESDDWWDPGEALWVWAEQEEQSNFLWNSQGGKRDF